MFVWILIVLMLCNQRNLLAEIDTSKAKLLSVDTCSGLFWFHAPKTGSTLYMALQHVCCPIEFNSLVMNITTEQLVANEFLPAQQKDVSFKFEHGSITLKRSNHTFTCKTRINIDHNPLKFDPNTKPNHRLPPLMVVGVIREPKSRIISSFLDGMHHEGMTNDHDFKVLRKKWEVTSSDPAREEQRLVGFAQDYANHPNMVGCQVKMLNGYECYSPSLFPFADSSAVNLSEPVDRQSLRIPVFNRTAPLNQTAIDIALSRLRQFRFVGLFDQFNASVHLLHRVMSSGGSGGSGSGTSPSPVELYQKRNSSKLLTALLSAKVTVFDPYDSVVYAEAQRLFREQLAKFNMSV